MLSESIKIMNTAIIKFYSKKIKQLFPKINLNVSNFYFIKSLLKKRPFDAHKGVFGHGLLIAGNLGMAGAAVFSAKACIKSGIGHLTIHTPECNRIVLQSVVPECTLSIDENNDCFSSPCSVNEFQAIGIGPGLGQSIKSSMALHTQLEQINRPLVLDADALNIISKAKHLLSLLPNNTIITPHPKEFDRLTTVGSTFQLRLQEAIKLTRDHNIIVVLKGAPTLIFSPGDVCHINTTGNAGMATAGSGDILTGIILSLLSQRYDAVNASIISVFLHGLAGDIAANHLGEISVTASDIVDKIPEAWSMLYR